MFNKNIFRNKALEKLSAPEEFDIPLKIISVRSWIFLLLLLTVIAAVLIWLSFSRINQEVDSRGIIVKEEHLSEVLAVKSGFIDRIFFHPADSVRKGDVLLSLVSAEDKVLLSDAESDITAALYRPGSLYEKIELRSAVRSPVDGILFEQIAAEGSYVRTGDKLLTIEKRITGGRENEFTVTGFISGKIINAIHKGTPVLISPKNIDVKEYGYLTGEVIRVAGYPVSQDRMEMLGKKNPSLSSATGDKTFEVTIIPKRKNGELVWTSNKVPATKFINGTYCDIKLIISDRSFFSYIIH